AQAPDARAGRERSFVAFRAAANRRGSNFPVREREARACPRGRAERSQPAARQRRWHVDLSARPRAALTTAGRLGEARSCPVTAPLCVTLDNRCDRVIRSGDGLSPACASPTQDPADDPTRNHRAPTRASAAERAG